MCSQQMTAQKTFALIATASFVVRISHTDSHSLTVFVVNTHPDEPWLHWYIYPGDGSEHR